MLTQSAAPTPGILHAQGARWTETKGKESAAENLCDTQNWPKKRHSKRNKLTTRRRREIQTATDLSTQFNFAGPGFEKMVGTLAIATSVVSTHLSYAMVTMTSRRKKMKKTQDLKVI